MNNRKLLGILGIADEKYIDQAENYKRRPIIKWSAIATCLVLVIAASFFMPQQSGKQPVIGTMNNTPTQSTNSDNLPMLSINGYGGSMGFEAFTAYDISEIVSGNPWREDVTLETLPVFDNTAQLNDHFQIIGSDFPAEAFEKEVTSRMKLPDAEIEQETPGGIAIWFDEPISLPDEYNFRHHMSYDDAQKTADYLLEQYGDLIAFNQPAADIYYGDYNIYGQQSHYISFYEASGDYVADILAFNFNRVSFYPNDNGKLKGIRVQTDGFHTMSKLGDYPIITLDEAKEKLKKGELITTVPSDYDFDLSKPLKCELVYRTGYLEECFMPYYRFYVEIDDHFSKANELGLKTYGAFYVPAVCDEYIADMPVWDGRFN